MNYWQEYYIETIYLLTILGYFLQIIFNPSVKNKFINFICIIFLAFSFYMLCSWGFFTGIGW